MIVQRLCTVVTGTNIHAVAAEHFADVVRVHLIDGKGNDTGMVVLPL